MTFYEFITIICSLITVYYSYKQNKQYKEKKNQNIINQSKFISKDDIIKYSYCFVEPNCTDIDPAKNNDLKKNELGCLFSVLDKYLLNSFPSNNSIHHIFIFGDSGMGKTTSLFCYYLKNLRRTKSKRQTIEYIPLGIPKIEQYISNIGNKKDTILFLDALDEYIEKHEDFNSRFSELMEQCNHFKGIVLTCRPQLFLKDNDIPKHSGIIKFFPRKAGEKRTYTFKKLYLLPLNDTQVEIYLKRKYRINFFKRKAAQNFIKKIPKLKIRPMLLANISDIIDDLLPTSSIEKFFLYVYATYKFMAKEIDELISEDIYSEFELYQKLINNWLEREEGKISKKDLQTFSEELAFYLCSNKEKDESEMITFSQLFRLGEQFNIFLEDFLKSSLLKVCKDGKFKFAHRSIMEFFFVVHFFKLNNDQRPYFEWTEQQKQFAIDMLKIRKENNFSKVDFSGVNLTGADFKQMNLEYANFTYTNLEDAAFNSAKLTNSIFSNSCLHKTDFSFASLNNAIFKNVDISEAKLYDAYLSGAIFIENINLPKWIEEGLDKNKTYSQINLMNSIKKGFKGLDKAKLKLFNLENTDLSKGSISKTKLHNVNFFQSNLSLTNMSDSNFFKINFKEANLEKSNLSGTLFYLSNLKNANFYGANLEGSRISNCNVAGVNFNKANLTGASFPLTDYYLIPDFEGANLTNADVSDSMKIGLDKNGIYSKQRLVKYLKSFFGRGCYMWFLNLKNVDLQGSKFYSSDIRFIDFENANLIDTTFAGSLGNVNFKGANLSNANFKKSYWDGPINAESTNFCAAKNLPEWIQKGLDKNGIYSQKTLVESIRNGFNILENLNLSNADLSNINFRNFIFSNANLRGANLQYSKFDHSDIGKTDLSLTTLDGANFKTAKGLCKWIIMGLDKHGNYSTKNLVKAIENGFRNLATANLESVNLEGRNLFNSNLAGANLAGANLIGANLSKSNLKGANLKGANLQRAKLEDANLDGANIKKANLSEANLTNTNPSLLKNIFYANIADANGLNESIADVYFVHPL